MKQESIRAGTKYLCDSENEISLRRNYSAFTSSYQIV